MAETLFTSQTPAVQGTDGSPGITTSTTVQFAADGSVTGIQFYATDTPSGTYTAAIWQVTGNDSGAGGTGTLLASKTASSAAITGGAYNTITFDTPVDVTTGVLYRCGLHNPSLYVATNGFFAGPLTNGNITAPANGSDPLSNGWTLSQGAFIIDAALQYPRQVGSSASYFVGPVFEADGGAQEIVPSGIAVTAALGTPALAQPLTVVPSGIAVTAALGTPTIAQSLSIVPSGIAVTAALGTPALAQALSITPSGIAVTAGLGTPSVSQTVEPGFAITPDGIAVVVLLGSPTVEQTADQGSWESLSAIVREARIDHEHNRERERNPLDCPDHGWPLQRTSRGLHCLFGGHVVR